MVKKKRFHKSSCSFVKMGKKHLQLYGKKRDKEERRKILEDREKRLKEFKSW